MENMELNVNEMEEVVGGKGGSPKMLPAKAGLKVYQIRKGDNLHRIANRCRCTVKELMAINPTITDANDITAGYYIYLPNT